MTRIEKMRKDGYSKIIKGNGGYRAYLKDMQPLGGGDYMAIYRYPGGEMLPQPRRNTKML